MSITNLDLWNKDYWYNPCFDDIESYLDKSAGKYHYFCHCTERENDTELYFQRCLFDHFDLSQYEKYETELSATIIELANEYTLFAYAGDYPCAQSENSASLAGMSLLEFDSLHRICCSRHNLMDADEINRILRCATRGFAVVCILIEELNVLLFIQDLHGCIIPKRALSEQALCKMRNLFAGHSFCVL